MSRPLRTLGRAGARRGSRASRDRGPAGPPQKPDSPGSFANVLDLQGVPSVALPGDPATDVNPIGVFADRGAWHAYALPKAGDTSSYGAFTGPLYIAQEYPWWLSKGISHLTLSENGRAIDLASATDPVFTSLPGMLQQSFDVDGLHVVMQLRYAERPDRAGAGVRGEHQRPRPEGRRGLDRLAAAPGHRADGAARPRCRRLRPASRWASRRCVQTWDLPDRRH